MSRVFVQWLTALTLFPQFLIALQTYLRCWFVKRTYTPFCMALPIIGKALTVVS